METGMIIEKQELFFLLSCKGCRSCPSVFRPDVRGTQEEILESLFRKEWIVNTGKHFQVERKIAETVRQIAEAEETLCLCHGNRRRELLYLYPGEKILAVQESFLRKNALRVFSLAEGDLRLFLEEQGILDKGFGWEPAPYVDESAEMMPQQLERRSDLAAYPWLCLLVTAEDGASSQIHGRMGVMYTGFQKEIVTELTADGIVRKEPYAAERLTELLLERLCGKSADDREGA